MARRKNSLLIHHIFDKQSIAREILYQSNPMSAWGEGLDEIAKALELPPRMEHMPGLETDCELRVRILEALDEG